MNMSTIKAVLRYVLIRNGVCLQFLYNHDAVTNLPTSNTDPITTTGQNADANIVVRPMIE